MASKEKVRLTLERIWDEIRGAPLAAGQPRDEASAGSVRLARKALRLAEDSGDDGCLAQAWRMMAYTLNANEEYENAIPYYQQAIERFRKIGEPGLAARMTIGYMTALANVARFSEAISAAAPASEWFEEHQDDRGAAGLHVSLGIVHARLDEYAEAVAHYSIAARTFERLGDKAMLARTYQNLGNILGNTDQFDQADEFFTLAERFSEELQLSQLSTQITYNHAYLYYLRGRYSAALRSFSRIRTRDEVSASPRYLALCDLDEAEIYVQLSLSQDASVLAERAIARFREIGMPYEEGRATAFYGVALMQMHRFAEALEAFGGAQSIFEKSGNAYWIGLLNLYRAEAHLSLGRLWEAQSLATQARLTFEQLSISSKRIFSLVMLGRVSLALNDLASAEAATNEIAGLAGTTQAPLVLFPYHVLCGEIAERSREWKAAMGHFESAALELEHHHARLHHDDLRVTFFKHRQQAYDALVRLSLDRMEDQAGLASAYSWCERARSRGLVELLSHYAPSLPAHADPSLLSRINRLREELNLQYARSRPEARPLPAEPDYEAIAVKEQELARALREVSGMDPEYASLQGVSIATVETIREALPENTTLVEYFTAGNEILAFIVSKDGASVVRHLCPAGRIVSLQERLAFQLEKFQLGSDYTEAHSAQILQSTRRRLHELYQHLMAPFIAGIHTPHITIVPHGTLHFLPFHAFFDGERYLIDEYEVSYAPSASVLKHCLDKPAVPDSSPVLIGVADEKAPLVGEEVAQLSRLLPNARVFRDEQATRAAFLEHAREASFIHIATHAVFRRDNPMFSSFKLADGWVTAFDLFSMQCRTNMIALSGCQSGLNEVTGSDDLLGLMRGFLYAGARSLLLSLWSVNDEFTASLMVRFYEEWSKGTAKSTALRSAMISLREKQPNPFYWAPFFLVGNP